MEGGTPDFLTLSLTDKSSGFLFLPGLLLGVAVVAVAVESLALAFPFFFFFFTVLTLRLLDAKPLHAEAPSANS